MSKRTLSENLLDISAVTTESYLANIKKAKSYASMAIKSSTNISLEDMHELDQLDTYARLERNLDALAYLLSMAGTVAENIKSEIHAIFDAIDKRRAEEIVAKRAALEREIELEKKRKHNELVKKIYHQKKAI